jgi:hypothetical protein
MEVNLGKPKNKLIFSNIVKPTFSDNRAILIKINSKYFLLHEKIVEYLIREYLKFIFWNYLKELFYSSLLIQKYFKKVLGGTKCYSRS